MSIPASATTTCSGAPSPRMASAAATARSRGAARRAGGARRRGRPWSPAAPAARAVDVAEVPNTAIWRPSSPSSHGLPPEARWHSRQRAQRGVRRVAADQRRRAPDGQRGGPEHGRRGHAAEQAQQVDGRAGVAGAGGDRRAARGSSSIRPREVGEHLERRAVGPLRVVDQQHERAARRASAEHSQKTLWPTIVWPRRAAPPSSSRRRGRRGRRAAARARGRARRAAAPRAACARRRRGSGAPAGRGRRGAPRSRRRAAHAGGVVEQRGLAEAGGGLEQDEGAGAGGGAGDGAVERVELSAALEQRAVGVVERWGGGRAGAAHGGVHTPKSRAHPLSMAGDQAFERQGGAPGAGPDGVRRAAANSR